MNNAIALVKNKHGKNFSDLISLREIFFDEEILMDHFHNRKRSMNLFENPLIRM